MFVLRFYFSYKDAVDFISTYRFSSRSDYRNFLNSVDHRLPLPYNPEQFYIDDFKSWSDFLSSNIVSQEELSIICNKHNLRNVGHYTSFVKVYGKKLRMPLSPERHYSGLGERFVGFKKLLQKNFLCISCASKWAMNSGIKKKSEWRKLGRSFIPITIHINLARYENVDFDKFIKGEYYDSYSCTCEGFGDRERQ